MNVFSHNANAFLLKYGLIIIIVIASILRLFALSSLPSGFHNDEASFLYNAIALKETGKDEDGRTFPLFLNSFIDPKPALYSYLQIPFITLLGPTYTAARLPAVIFGVLSIVFLYFIGKELLDEKYALVMAFLLSLSPWHIMVSRATQEVIMSFCFSLIAIYVLLLLLKKNTISITYILLLFLFSFLAMYSYHSAKIFLPIILIAITTVKIGKKNMILTIGVILIAIATFLLSFVLGGTVRFQAVSIFTDQRVQLIMNEEIGTATGHIPHLVIRTFYNKVIAYSMAIIDQYFQYLNGDFLFISGGQPNRYLIPFQGLFYYIEILLLLIGLITAFMKKMSRNELAIFLIWAFVAILPAAISVQESPSTIRSFPLIVPLLFFIAVGIITIVENKTRIIRVGAGTIIVLGYIWGISYFLNQFIVQEPNYHPWNRYYAEEQLVPKAKKLSETYDHVVIQREGDSYIYFALAGEIPLSDLQSSYPKRKSRNYTFGKYTFADGSSCPLGKSKESVYIVDVSCKINKKKYSVIDKVTYKDGADKYLIVKKI